MSWNNKPEIKKTFFVTLFTDRHLKNFFLIIILVNFSKKKKKKGKITYLLGDSNLNLDYHTKLKAKPSCNTAFSHNFIPTIIKPALVYKS